MVKHEILESLIDLSNIFKQGFTIKLNQETNEFNQYSSTKKPFIVSYKTIISINKNIYPHNITYHKVDTLELNNCIIGAWFDPETNIYYIELNKVYSSKSYALKIAKKYNQKAIYDLKKELVIYVDA